MHLIGLIKASKFTCHLMPRDLLNASTWQDLYVKVEQVFKNTLVITARSRAIIPTSVHLPMRSYYLLTYATFLPHLYINYDVHASYYRYRHVAKSSKAAHIDSLRRTPHVLLICFTNPRTIAASEQLIVIPLSDAHAHSRDYIYHRFGWRTLSHILFRRVLN